jgi:hypothetical protein
VWVLGDNLWISVDKLLEWGGGCLMKTALFPLPTTNPHLYTQKKVVEVDKKAGLNCGFVSFPQLPALVTTNTFIYRKQVVREPARFKPFNNELGL